MRMLTGQPDGSRPIADLDVLGFSLAFGGLLGMWGCVAGVGNLQQQVC